MIKDLGVVLNKKPTMGRFFYQPKLVNYIVNEHMCQAYYECTYFETHIMSSLEDIQEQI